MPDEEFPGSANQKQITEFHRPERSNTRNLKWPGMMMRRRRRRHPPGRRKISQEGTPAWLKLQDIKVWAKGEGRPGGRRRPRLQKCHYSSLRQAKLPHNLINICRKVLTNPPLSSAFSSALTPFFHYYLPLKRK